MFKKKKKNERKNVFPEMRVLNVQVVHPLSRELHFILYLRQFTCFSTREIIYVSMYNILITSKFHIKYMHHITQCFGQGNPIGKHVIIKIAD